MKRDAAIEAPVRERVSAEEWLLRCELAAAHRLVSHFVSVDLTYNHISVRVPGEPRHFLVKADKVFMDKLAKEGRGKAVTVSGMAGLLKGFLDSSADQGRAKQISWPDWKSKKPSGFLPLFLLIFVGLLTAEWFLRRRWGLV